MFAWKERVYALLLRRVLGPFLTRSSLAKLHESLTVSLTDGHYELTNLALNVAYLSDCLLHTANSNYTTAQWSLVAATIGKLSVQIRLQEDDHNETSNDSDTATSSLAWRAYQLGSSSSSTSANSVSLVVQVVLHDVSITLEPPPPPPHQNNGHHNNNVPTASSAAAMPEATTLASNEIPSSNSSVSHYIASYLEAALASLRLSVTCQNIRLRLQTSTSSPQSVPTTTTWMELRIQSALYNDAATELENHASAAAVALPSPDHPKPSATTHSGVDTYHTIVHKTVQVTRITVATGVSSSSSTAIAPMSHPLNEPPALVVGLMEGTSQCRWRLIQYQLVVSHDTTDADSQPPPWQQQDVQLMLHQKLNVSLDAVSLSHIQALVQSFARKPPPPNDSSTSSPLLSATTTTTTLTIGNEETTRTALTAEDEADYQTISGIMKQYQEARQLVERNQVRGGIIVPSSSNDDAEDTFDLFFDANDQSFARYSSVVMESIMYPNNAQHRKNSVGQGDCVHTKLLLHLQEGGIKLAFATPNLALTDIAPIRHAAAAPEEYILLTFNDVNLSSQLSSRSAEHSFQIGQLELEDAWTVSSIPPDVDPSLPSNLQTSTQEIATLLLFSPDANGEYDDDDEDADFLVNAPSVISMTVKTANVADKETISIDVMLEPFEVTYRKEVIDKLAAMLESKAYESRDFEDDPITSTDNMPRSLHIQISCPSLAVLLPVTVEKDWERLYHRCGYTTEGTPSRKSVLGLALERVDLELHQHHRGDVQTDVSVLCHNVIAFASSPKNKSNVFDQRTERFDIMALCGRTEIDPCIPVSVRYVEFSAERQIPGHGQSDTDVAVQSFPVVPSLSSFKARQDEDDDVHIDRNESLSATRAKLKTQKDSRHADPQASMLSEVAQCQAVITIHIPEILGDLSSTEMLVLMEMIDALDVNRGSSINVRPTRSPQARRTAISVHCDFMSLAVHGDSTAPVGDERKSPATNSIFSLLIKMDEFKGHILAEGTNLRQSRVLAHEVDVFESTATLIHTNSIPTVTPSPISFCCSFGSLRGYSHGQGWQLHRQAN
jgi:hypothetical protein